MNTQISLSQLTVPEALMLMVHAKNGVPIEAAKPGQLAAAAELAELVLLEHARLDGKDVVLDAPVDGSRDWITEVTTQWAGERLPVRTWIAQRKDALRTQQQEAAARGLLHQGRKKFLGLFPYSTSTVDPSALEAILAEVTAPGAERDARAVLVARLVVKTKLHLWHGWSAERRNRLVELSEVAPENTPVPRALSATDIAIGTVIYTTVIGD